MINLLPPETKRQIRAARMNVILVNYCLIILSTALVLGAVFAVGFWTNFESQRSAIAAKDQNTQAAAAYTATRQQAEAFAADLEIARTILASNISFSQLILDIAAVVPAGVVLDNLSLGTISQKTPLDINGRAVSSDAAVALKNSLAASAIFDDASIVNIEQSDPGATNTDPLAAAYPFTVNIKAQFSQAYLNGSKQ